MKVWPCCLYVNMDGGILCPLGTCIIHVGHCDKQRPWNPVPISNISVSECTRILTCCVDIIYVTVNMVSWGPAGVSIVLCVCMKSPCQATHALTITSGILGIYSYTLTNVYVTRTSSLPSVLATLYSHHYGQR